MDYSPEFEQAVRSVNPSIQPSQLAQVYGQMRQQFPDASEQDFADAVASAGVVSGKLPAQGMSPSVMQGVSEYQNAVQADQVVKQKQQELNGINQGLQTSQQNIAQLQQMIDNPTGPQDLVNAQNQVQQGRNQVGENIGHIIAALGGNGVSQNYQNFIAGKRRDEQQVVQNVKDRMSAEAHQLQFQKAKDEYVEMRRQINQKYKEDVDRNDPNSQVSVITRALFASMSDNVPALKNVPNVENMSAAQLEKYFPFATKMSELAQKKIDADRKARESDAKIALENANLGKIQAETEAKRQETARGGKEAMTTNQGITNATKLTEDIAKHEESINGASESMDNINTLKDAYSRTSTGPIVGSDYAMAARKILPGGGDVQAIGNAEARLLASMAKTFGANPSDAETRLLKSVSQLSKLDPTERDSALARIEQAIVNRRNTATNAKQQLTPLLQRSQEAAGVTPSAKKVVTMAQVRAKAKELGASEEDLIAQAQKNGYEVQ